MAMHYIYAVRNKINACVYVGQTQNPNQRKATHFYCARRGDTKPLYQAIRELGAEHFSFEVLEEHTDPLIASQREEFWVKHFDSFNNGYNLTHGGGFHVGNKGRKFSIDHRRKLSKAHTGKIVSKETKEKISNASRLRRGENHHMFGKYQSDETRANISAAMKKLYASTTGDEVRNKIRHTLTGRKLTEGHRQRIGKAGRGRKHSPETITKMKSHQFSDIHKQRLREAALRREEQKRQERI